MNHCFVFLTIALLTAEFLWPSEAALNGDGLRYAALWLLTAAAHLLWKLRSTDSASAPAFSRYSLAAAGGLLLLVIGHWLSTFHVFAIHGDRRAALNLTFEWSAAGAACWLTFQAATINSFRYRLIALLIGAGIGLSIVGLWQHHFFYKAQADWYRQQRDQLDSGTANASSVQPGQAYESLRARERLQNSGIPTSGAERQLFEQRLLSSTEPFGTFALANTLSGVLAVAIVLLTGCLTSPITTSTTTTSQNRSAASQPGKKLSLPIRAVMICGMVLLLYCLVLTKSRTAWAGCAFGVTTAYLLSKREHLVRQAIKAATVGLASVVAIGAISLSVGAIDREVIMESSRSLQFRLFYWAGAIDVIQQEPVWGTGPGNFRQVYLAHKRVESSEEILDPHNIVLDAWATTGLAGGLGILLIAGASLATIAYERADSDVPRGLQNQAPRKSRSGLFVAAVLSGWGLNQLTRWYDQEAWTDSQMAFLAVPLACAIVQLLPPAVFRCPRKVVTVALLAFLVHLLGAGGLQITIVGFLIAVLLGLSACSFPPGVSSGRGKLRSAATGIALCLAVPVLAAVVVYGIIPVQNCRSWVALGDHHRELGDSRSARKAYEQAAAADPLAPYPRQRNMELAAYLLVNDLRRLPVGEEISEEDRIPANNLVHEAMAACETLSQADQRLALPLFYRSQIHRNRSRLQEPQAAIASAIQDMELVIQRYPSNNQFWVEVADLYNLNNDSAKASAAAGRALQIDDINHNWGHRDRYLSTEQRNRMNQLAVSDSD